MLARHSEREAPERKPAPEIYKAHSIAIPPAASLPSPQLSAYPPRRRSHPCRAKAPAPPHIRRQPGLQKALPSGMREMQVRPTQPTRPTRLASIAAPLQTKDL